MSHFRIGYTASIPLNLSKLNDVKSELAQGQHKELKDTIDMIQNIGQSVDQKIFDINVLDDLFDMDSKFLFKTF